MLSNYFTLVQIAHVIHQQSAGTRISELYSQNKQQLCISIESHPSQTVIVSCEASGNFLYLREGNYRARKNSVNLFPAARGKKIQNVRCDQNDRVVIAELEDNLTLECEMFTSRANVILWKLENGGTVEVAVDAFMKKKEIVGTHRPVGEKQKIPAYGLLIKNEDLFLDTVRANSGETVFSSLKKTIAVLGSTLVKEILLRAEVLPSTPLSLVTDRELKRIYAETAKIVAAVNSPVAEGQARIYYEGQSPLCFSLIPLRTFEQSTHESFANASAAIQRFVSSVRASSTFTNNKEQVSTWLEKEEKKAAQTLQKISSESTEHDRASEYEIFGKLLMAHLHELRKGMKSIELQNTLSSPEGRTLTIPLEPALTPVLNAEKYFNKAKKARTAHDDALTRMKSLEVRLSTLRMLHDELADVQSNEALKQFQQTYKVQLQQAGYLTVKEQENLPPFRIFTVEGGFQVLAGKSSDNNDMLTMKYAKPNDLWFHCRGSSGSHVVLKMNSAQGEPSKAAIHQAASIAAYYSKMKNASSVPVAMTEKKFVRKPKGAPAGTVILEREKVIFVQPKLPFPSN
jgi:predicted ribosome quality control (RQC) complex YloA/Tae2 family protein